MENKPKLKALNTIVIVKEVLLENKTDFGFDLSNVVDVNETQKKGIVKSVGELCPKVEYSENKNVLFQKLSNFIKKILFIKPKYHYTLKIDDVVLFDRNKCTPITIEGVKYIMIDYRDLYIRL